MKRIDCFIPYTSENQVKQTVLNLQKNDTINKIVLMGEVADVHEIKTTTSIQTTSLCATKTLSLIAGAADSDYILIYTKESTLEPGYLALERMLKIADDTQAGLTYSDFYSIVKGERSIHPVIDYQKGSLRDDFDFGSLLLFNTKAFKKAVQAMNEPYSFAALYDLRLRVSQTHPIVHINEYLYTEVEQDARKSGEKLFDYVDPKNRDRQLEMEKACSEHLKMINGYLAPSFTSIEFNENNFPVEASVIIPVRNRERTIKDAIVSVLSQKTTFPFNLIIIDNHSTDKTSEIINSFSDNEKIIHIIPEREDLGIGGCWNLGVHHHLCGKFAVQLDSDDIYSNEGSLQTMVDAFYQQNCAMVIGTYMMTNFDLEMIPPGIIDHKEWTPENGRNNALRINGLGAPRAFYTPILRDVKVPNTSYGEDYALGLNFSRKYQIGRIYDVVYNCRRWDDNSDASLDIIKMNQHNFYKDKIRTWELEARIALNTSPIR